MKENSLKKTAEIDVYALGDIDKPLTKTEKGKLLSYLAQEIGGTRDSWQQRLSKWAAGRPYANMNPLVLNALNGIMVNEAWR